MSNGDGRPWQGAAVGVGRAADGKIVRDGEGHRHEFKPDLTDVQAYLDLLYEDRPGWVVLGTGRMQLVQGKPKMLGFRERGFYLPNYRDRLLKAIAAAVHDREDVFLTVLQRSSATRKEADSHPLPGRHVWLDLDAHSSELEQALLATGVPVHLVDSGGQGIHRHAYLDVGTVLPAERLVDLARRTRAALGGAAAGVDTDGGGNKYLRPPGTFNHKNQPLAGWSGQVRRLETLNAGQAPDLARLERYLEECDQPPPIRSTKPWSHEELRGAAAPAVEQYEQPCRRVQDQAMALRKQLTEQDGRHKALLQGLMGLHRAHKNGHLGVQVVLPELRAEFIEAVHADRGARTAAAQEFDAALPAGMVDARLSDPDRLCDCQVEDYRAWLQQPDLVSGRGRRTDRKVLASLVREASRRRSRQVRKSQRQLAADAQCSVKSVGAALARLQAAGLIVVVPSRGQGMTTVQLPRTAERTTTSGLVLPAGTAVVALQALSPTHPLFGSAGLRGGHELTFNMLDQYESPVGRGKFVAVRRGYRSSGRRAGRRPWRDISPPSGRGGQTTSQIAALTGQSVSAVRGQLQQMERLGMVIKVSGNWWRTRWDAEEVAVELGSAGAVDRQERRHQEERRRYWEGRAQLPDDDGRRVIAHRRDNGQIDYVHPHSGEVLWSSMPVLPLGSEREQGGLSEHLHSTLRRYAVVIANYSATQRMPVKEAAALLAEAPDATVGRLLQALVECDCISTQTLRSVILETYRRPSVPGQLSVEEWRRLLVRTGYVRGSRPATPPRRPVTLYRSSAWPDGRGLVWWARQAAASLGAPGAAEVLVCQVPPSRLLADLGGNRYLADVVGLPRRRCTD